MLGKGGGWIQQVKGVGRSPLCFERIMVNVLNTQKVLLFISLCNLYFTELQSVRLSPLNFHSNPINEPHCSNTLSLKQCVLQKVSCLRLKIPKDGTVKILLTVLFQRGIAFTF